MKQINLQINGKNVTGHKGMTILQVAENEGIQIPTLCHRKDLAPSGNCRICVVELENLPRLVAACHTPISEGMVVKTETSKVKSVRNVNLELLMTAHTGTCVTDIHARECKLHNTASAENTGSPRFNVKNKRYFPIETASPYVKRNLSACILCRNCVRACREIAKKDILAIAYRGFRSKVVVDCDVELEKEECKDCGICIDYCPTSALTRPNEEAL